VHFVESVGGRAAPVFYNASPEDRTLLFQQLSGLLLSGGHCDAVTEFFEASEAWFELAAAANRAGDIFPIHGICQGFQQLSQWAAGGTSTKTVLSATDAENLLLPLQTPNGTSEWPPKQSWLLAGMPNDVSEALLSTPCTVNLHHWGISPSLYQQGARLDNGIFRMLAVNHDRAQNPFVSLIEGIALPFTGSQYHPEKNAFEFGGRYNTDSEISAVHSDIGIDASRWLARRLMVSARKSTHRWNYSAGFQLMREFSTVPGGVASGFDWEEAYFWGQPFKPDTSLSI